MGLSWCFSRHHVATVLDAVASRCLPTRLQRTLVSWAAHALHRSAIILASRSSARLHHRYVRENPFHWRARLSPPFARLCLWDICLYVGHVTEDDGTHLYICNSIHDLKRLHTISPISQDAPRYTSLGVHDGQLTPEEFFAHLTVEVSANWDFIVESRSRPRLSQLHPHATGDTADEVLGTRSADTVDVGDVSHAANVDVSEDPQHDAQKQLCRKLDVTYAPLVHLRDLSSSPLDVIHRLAVAKTMDGRAGDKYLNVEQFVRAHRSAYKSIMHHRAIDADKMLHNHMAKIVSIQDELSAVARQRDISTKRNEVETGARAATPAELRTIAPHEPYEDDPGDAIRIDISELGASPAEYARYLAVRHGIVNSEDQYNALILAVLPLEQLWRWAAEEGRLSDLNDPASALLLLQDAPPRFLGRLFCHGPGGSGKTFFITTVVQPTYARYLPQSNAH